MRTRIKLIDVCVRHKCTGNTDANFSTVKPSRQFQHRIIRVKRKEQSPSEASALTSESIIGDGEIHEDVSRSDETFGDTGMRALHRSKIDAEEPEIVSSDSSKVGGKNFTGDAGPRFNELGMQMLSRRLYEQMFPKTELKDRLTGSALKSLRKELLESGMNIDKVDCLPDVDIDLPVLEGRDIEEHFYNVARDQTKQYRAIIHEVMRGIPEMPDKWLLQEGWTRY